MEINFNEDLKNFMDAEGKLRQFPRKRRPRMIALFFLASKFKHDVVYSEKDVNNILNENHTFNDSCMLRRELFDRRFLGRTKTGSKYWLMEVRPDLENLMKGI